MSMTCFLARMAVAVTLTVFTPYAEAQTRTACAERTTVVKRLAEKYGETLQSLGLHQNNAVVEVYASDETGSWTILMTRPDGVACLMASGQMWEAQAGELIPKGTAL